MEKEKEAPIGNDPMDKRYYLILVRASTYLRVHASENDVKTFCKAAENVGLDYSYKIDPDQRKGTWM